jgi:hypothetical protein
LVWAEAPVVAKAAITAVFASFISHPFVPVVGAKKPQEFLLGLGRPDCARQGFRRA